MNTPPTTNTYWPVFMNLEREVKELSFSIHINDEQLNVYSSKIIDLILRAAIEIESISKELCAPAKLTVVFEKPKCLKSNGLSKDNPTFNFAGRLNRIARLAQEFNQQNELNHTVELLESGIHHTKLTTLSLEELSQKVRKHFETTKKLGNIPKYTAEWWQEIHRPNGSAEMAANAILTGFIYALDEAATWDWIEEQIQAAHPTASHQLLIRVKHAHTAIATMAGCQPILREKMDPWPTLLPDLLIRDWVEKLRK